MLSTRTRLISPSPISSLRRSRPRCAPHRLQHPFQFHSSSIPPDQESSLDAWISQTLSTNHTHTYTDDLSPSKLADLFCTLPTRSHLFNPTSTPGLNLNTNTDNHDETTSPPFAPGVPLPPLHTLIYFHPRTPEPSLGPDGTDTHFRPPYPFTRRMWAGGSFRFPSPSGLHVGHPATARASVRNIEKKGFERGTPMIFVHQHIDYSHRDQEEERPLISEERIHVYLPRELRAASRVVHEVTGLPKPQYTFSWTPTPTTLFRFSALTWNGHLIHLDPAYARNEEGYPERLVHGPLSALMLIEALYHEGYTGRIDNFVYRARNPTIVGRRQHVRGAFSPEGNTATLWTEDDDGVVGMTGTVDLLA